MKSQFFKKRIGNNESKWFELKNIVGTHYLNNVVTIKKIMNDGTFRICCLGFR